MTYDVNTKKIPNLYAPILQIIIEGEDILHKYNKRAATVTVEHSQTDPPRFSFTIDDDYQLNWVNSNLFEIGKSLQIRAGYADSVETLINAEIASLKTVFSSTGGPQIVVSGENNNSNSATLTQNNAAVVVLEYGDSLLNLTCETSIGRGSEKNSTVQISAECVGTPVIKPGATVVITGLGSRFNQNYTVEKSIHRFGDSGYITVFNGKAQSKKIAPLQEMLKTLKDKQEHKG